MSREQKMYVAVEAREDFIFVDGSESKFYPHPFINGIYASRDGEVARKRLVSEKVMLLGQHEQNNGYIKVTFNNVCDEGTLGVMMNRLVHRLVLETFEAKPNDIEDWVVDHINNKRYDNRLSNLRWLTRSENIQKRDEDGSLNKVTYVYDRVTDMVTKYDSRLLAAEAIDYFVSNMVTALKKEIIIRGRYFVSDSDYLLPEDYYFIFKEYDLKRELIEVKKKKQKVMIDKISKLTDDDTYNASKGFKFIKGVK